MIRMACYRVNVASRTGGLIAGHKKGRPRGHPRLCRCTNQSVFPGYLTKDSIRRLLQKKLKEKTRAGFSPSPGSFLGNKQSEFTQSWLLCVVCEWRLRIRPGPCQAEPSWPVPVPLADRCSPCRRRSSHVRRRHQKRSLTGRDEGWG